MVSRSKRLIKDLAFQRINWLFRLALDLVRKNEIDLARRYVEIIFAISRKANIRLPWSIKHRICRNCHTPLLPGVNASIRLLSDGKTSRIVIRCKHCGWIHRYPYKPPRKKSSGKGRDHEY